jgi:hypothetical protein
VTVGTGRDNNDILGLKVTQNISQCLQSCHKYHLRSRWR